MENSNIERQAQANLLKLAQLWCEAKAAYEHEIYLQKPRRGRPRNGPLPWIEYIGIVGYRATNEGKFFEKMLDRYKAGNRKPDDTKGSFTMKTYDDTLKWFEDADNWPRGDKPKLEIAPLHKEMT